MKNPITITYIPNTLSMVQSTIVSLVWLAVVAVAVYISGDSWLMSLITGGVFILIILIGASRITSKNTTTVFDTKEDLQKYVDTL